MWMVSAPGAVNFHRDSGGQVLMEVGRARAGNFHVPSDTSRDIGDLPHLRCRRAGNIARTATTDRATHSNPGSAPEKQPGRDRRSRYIASDGYITRR
jgi:hypothetical protein